MVLVVRQVPHWAAMTSGKASPWPVRERTDDGIGIGICIRGRGALVLARYLQT